MNIPGIGTTQCESFVKDGNLLHICESEIKHDLDLPSHILNRYQKELDEDKEAQKELGFMGCKTDDQKLIQFIKCRFGGSDSRSDITGKKTTPDWWNCGKHGTCEHEFTICKPVFTETGEKISRCEIAVIKLIAEDLSDQQIAERLFVSIDTIHSHRQHITSKIGCRSKCGIVRFAIERGITL